MCDGTFGRRRGLWAFVSDLSFGKSIKLKCIGIILLYNALESRLYLLDSGFIFGAVIF